MKLFEIPVYALSRNELKKRVEKYESKFYDNNIRKMIMNNVIYPKSVWDYNHIVGFIVICYQNQDIFLKWYTDLRAKKYHWNSNRKNFFQNYFIHGYRYNTEKYSKIEIIKKLREGIDEIAAERGYYVDLEAFDNMINYQVVVFKNNKNS